MNIARYSTLICFSLAVAFTAKVAVADEVDRLKKSRELSGDASEISDWALAGIVWSDASLTHQLLKDAMQQKDGQTSGNIKATSNEIRRIIKQLEQFGWTARKSTDAPGSANKAKNALTRFDTETPAGRDDPGLDDERTKQRVDLDIDQYRVDDYVDETPQEARSLADAREDGVEGAIAAASTRGISGPSAGRISEREAQTRSATLPYAEDSIYDADDYDPDVDYDVNNPNGASPNAGVGDRGDGDDDINRDRPAKVVEGEDELLATMLRNSKSKQGQSKTSIDRFTDQQQLHSQDARWVQFRVDANQLRYSKLGDGDKPVTQAKDALRQLKTSAMIAGRSTSNQKLRSVLETILALEL